MARRTNRLVPASGERSGHAWADPPGSPSRAARWSAAILCLTALLLPLLFVPTLPDAFALPRLVALYVLVPLALAGPIVALVIGPPPTRTSVVWMDGAAVVFGILAVAAWLLSPALWHNLQGEPLQYQGLLPLLLYLAAYACARFALREARRVRRLLVLVVVAGAVSAAYALMQQARLDPIWHALDKGRVFGTLGQANALGAYLVLALPAATVLAATSRGVARLGAAWAGLMILAALVLSYSRGAYLGAAGAAVGLVLLGARSWRSHDACGGRRLGRHAGPTLVGAGIVAVVLMVLPATRDMAIRATERALSTADLQEGSIADRLDLWTVGVRISLDHPLLGIGPDSYALEFPDYRDAVLPPGRAAFMGRFRPESPHNVYLALADGLGLPALAAYLALTAGALAAAWRTARRAEGEVAILAAAVGAMLVGHLVTDAFMTAELAGSLLFWVLLGVAVGLPGAAEDRMATRAPVPRRPDRASERLAQPPGRSRSRGP